MLEAAELGYRLFILKAPSLWPCSARHWTIKSIPLEHFCGERKEETEKKGRQMGIINVLGTDQTKYKNYFFQISQYD